MSENFTQSIKLSSAPSLQSNALLQTSFCGKHMVPLSQINEPVRHDSAEEDILLF
jgi:hypothetical protein